MHLHNELFECSQCGTYPSVDGIPMFCRDRDVYYGEVPKADMRQILSRAEAIGWRSALLEHADTKDNTDFYEYASGATRTAFRFILNADLGTVLDYGCGPGAITIALAQSAKAVYATDLTHERVAFARIRAQQEGLSNVHVFCAGDMSHIPVADAFFDTIILDGVLEWLPEFSPGEPRSVQLRFLKELRRVLKPNGTLFVAIENRIGFGYFRGKPEDHTRLRFISLMPRRLANRYSLLAKGKPFRPYTYTKSEHTTLFNEAGFESVDFWGLLPDYRRIERAVDLSQPKMFPHAFNRAATGLKKVRNAVATPLVPFLADSFGIRASSYPGWPFAEELLQHISGSYLNSELLSLQQYKTSGHNVHIWAEGKQTYIIKVPMSASAGNRLQAGAKASDTANRLAAIPIPKLIACSKYKGVAFAVEVAAPGSPVNATAIPPSSIMEILSRLCTNTRGAVRPWNQLLHETADRYVRRLEEAVRQRAALSQVVNMERLSRMIESLSDVGGSGSTCALHGDFWSGNILVYQGRITAILDWDRFDPSGLPFFDLFHFLTKQVQCSIDGHQFGDAIVEVYRTKLTSPLLEQYAVGISVDPQMASRFLMLYWLRQSTIMVTEDSPLRLTALRNLIEKPLQFFAALGKG